MEHVRYLVDDAADRGRETLVAVQLEDVLWRHRTQLSCNTLPTPKTEPINTDDSTVAAQDQPTPQERVLALVAAIANGEECCLLHLRVSHAILADQKAGVLESKGTPIRHRAPNGRVLLSNP